jgi:Mg2+ and Co2+ transporter CorA
MMDRDNKETDAFFMELVEDMKRRSLYGQFSRYTWAMRIMLEEYRDAYTERVKVIAARMDALTPRLNQASEAFRNNRTLILPDGKIENAVYSANVKDEHRVNRSLRDLVEERRGLLRQFDYIFDKRRVIAGFTDGTFDIRKEYERAVTNSERRCG